MNHVCLIRVLFDSCFTRCLLYRSVSYSKIMTGREYVNRGVLVDRLQHKLDTQTCSPVRPVTA